MEGLWSVAFATRMGANYGVVYFDGDRLIGGDSAFFWTGTVKQDGNDLRAELQARTHSGQPVLTIFGNSSSSFSVELRGSLPTSTEVGSTITVSGSGLTAKLTRRQ